MLTLRGLPAKLCVTICREEEVWFWLSFTAGGGDPLPKAGRATHDSNQQYMLHMNTYYTLVTI